MNRNGPETSETKAEIKRPYTKPRLHRLGSVRELTFGPVSQGGTDGSSGRFMTGGGPM